MIEMRNLSTCLGSHRPTSKIRLPSARTDLRDRPSAALASAASGSEYTHLDAVAQLAVTMVQSSVRLAIVVLSGVAYCSLQYVFKREIWAGDGIKGMPAGDCNRVISPLFVA